MSQLSAQQIQQLRSQAMFKHNRFEEKRIKRKERHISKPIRGMDGALLVQVIEAKNLKASDLSGKSDPYCICKVGKKRERTRVVKKDLNPKFDEKFVFRVKDHPYFKIKIKDKDRIAKDDVLGKVKLDLKYFTSGQPLDNWYDLNTRGSVHLKIQFLTAKLEGKLVCKVVEAKDLPAADIGGKSDPYVVCNIGKIHQRTSKVKHNLNPRWNQEFTFPVNGEQTIFFQVMDWDRFTRDDKLGSVVLKLRYWLPFFERGLGVDDWFSLHKKGSLHLQFHFIPDKSTPHSLPAELEQKEEKK